MVPFPPSRSPVTRGASASSLADVLARLDDDTSVPPKRRQEMQSAVRTFARAMGRDPGAIPAEPRLLRQGFAALSPAMLDIGKGRWANIRCLVLGALRQTGIKAMPGRGTAPLPPA